MNRFSRLKSNRVEQIRQAAFAVSATVGLYFTSSAAALAEQEARLRPALDEIPPFSLHRPFYDQATYWGRLQTMFDLINPSTLFTSDEELKRCQDLIDDYKSGVVDSSVTDADLWTARKTVEAIIHPVTGDKVFLPGRMSAFVPVNVPICAGMLMHGPTSTAAQVFWQWVNQSYNVVNNYANRSGKEIDMGPLLQSYALAVTASVGLAIGAGRAIKTYPVLASAGPFVPYLAVITAGACNVSFTRMEEMKKGIPVSDQEGNVLGVSQSAGKIAVFKTVTSRSMFLPIFPLLLPPLAMALLRKSALAANKPAMIAAELGIITCVMAGALPCALALQPQQMTIPVSSLEAKFQALKDSSGQPIEKVFANKGL